MTIREYGWSGEEVPPALQIRKRSEDVSQNEIKLFRYNSTYTIELGENIY